MRGVNTRTWCGRPRYSLWTTHSRSLYTMYAGRFKGNASVILQSGFVWVGFRLDRQGKEGLQAGERWEGKDVYALEVRGPCWLSDLSCGLRYYSVPPFPTLSVPKHHPAGLSKFHNFRHKHVKVVSVQTFSVKMLGNMGFRGIYQIRMMRLIHSSTPKFSLRPW